MNTSQDDIAEPVTVVDIQFKDDTLRVLLSDGYGMIHKVADG